ncbi:YdcF family protein [Pseudonocardia sp. KRD291]|uniref:YdcF family protein n=1 Tax=Pseudonocardia sp. KRD291 TaxID=2792007 RepID=UPI001C49EF41|nr:YdcF family protein [Pseudonocardia sp. KRD291]MBW0101369.1 YdcF family protein [Pseudonocardia sp. KRD291]
MHLLYAFSALFVLAFVIGTVRERRRFRNAVLLGLALVCLGLGLLGDVSRFEVGVLDVVTVLGALTALLAVIVLTGFLLVNGVTMIRREGRRPANLLSLLAGLACLVVLSLLVFVYSTNDRIIGPITIAVLLVAVYLGFLFCSFLLYAVVYARIAARPGIDFVVVLGSGLIRGQVPPLLAARLHKAMSLRDEAIREGGAPVLLTSGGKGADEPVAEAEAMADYLAAHGVPPESILRETLSTTTLENLRYSRTIMARHAPDHRCVVVTNDYHVFRAALMARRAGLNGQVLGAATARYYWPSATIREFIAILAEHRAVHLVICALLLVTGVLLGAGR